MGIFLCRLKPDEIAASTHDIVIGIRLGAARVAVLWIEIEKLVLKALAGRAKQLLKRAVLPASLPR